MIEVRASSVRFYSPMDEDAFFDWLGKIQSIKEVYGEDRDIVLSFSGDEVSDADLHELIAVFRRYDIDKRRLRSLVNDKNQEWVRSWEADIFS